MDVPEVSRSELEGQFTQPPSVPVGWVEAVTKGGIRHQELTTHSLQAAFELGQRSATLSHAFFAGYQVALQVLQKKSRLCNETAALCVTERKGNRPYQIETRLVMAANDFSAGDPAYTLSGEKSFITGANLVDQWLVLAISGEEDSGRKQFKLVRLSTGNLSQHVRVAALPELPMVSRVPHGAAVFDGVIVRSEDLLPGCGYQDYVRRFRWLEDVHVMASILGCLQSLGQYWENRSLETLAWSLSAALFSLGVAPSASEGVDVVVYGWVGEQLRAILPGALNASVERHGNQVHELRRDLRLFSVAEEARARRIERFWMTREEAEPGSA